MRLLNDGDRYNQIPFAAAQFALASRWLKESFVRPVVMSPPVPLLDVQQHPMQQHQAVGQHQGLI